MVETEKKQTINNPLLEEIREGIGAGVVSTQNTKDAIDNSRVSEDKKDEIKKALDELKRKMTEIDSIISELKKKEELEKNAPKRTERLLTEIKVPSLDLLK